jgi:serine phosphatase RsbU (regulator of sigma subunit)
VRAANAQHGRCGDVAFALPLGSGRAVIVVVDVIGHGAAPAPLSSAIGDAIATALLRGASPAQALGCADNRLRTLAAESPYAVAFAALVHPSRTLVYASAGHDLAFALHDDGRIEQLAPTAPMLGIALVFRACDAVLPLDTTETLVIATDGVADSHPAGSKNFFSVAQVARVVKQSLREDGDPARAVLDAACAYGGGRQNDDMGVVVARVGTAEPLSRYGKILERCIR